MGQTTHRHRHALPTTPNMYYMQLVERLSQDQRLWKFQGYSVVGDFKGDERDLQVPCMEGGQVEECLERK